jgi:hypothetical protein
MDGGRGINMLYASTLDDLGIPRYKLRSSTAPLHGVIPGMEALPIGQIDLPVTFGDLQNFRIEILTFKVVGLSGTHHAILGMPAYENFMAVPNYTYLKLKIPIPKGIITVGTAYQCAFDCNDECFQFAEALMRSKRLHPRTRISPSRPSERPALLSPPRTSRMRISQTMATHSVSGQRLILNRKVHSSTSSKRTSTCSHVTPPV